MYVVTGATGHTGSVIAKKLLAQGKKVRVVGRSAERLSSLVSLGADPFAGDISKKEAVARAFSGAAAAYVMIPPDQANPDYPAYQDLVTEAVASALEKGARAHVVVLSSFGADKPDKTGPIAGLHRMEERLKRISGLNALFLRAGSNETSMAGRLRHFTTRSSAIRITSATGAASSQADGRRDMLLFRALTVR